MIKKLIISACLLLSISKAQEEKKPIHTFLGHSGAVNSIDVSPDGKFLISGSKDETIRIWDLENNTLTKTLNGLPSSAKRIKLNSTGNKFLVGFYSAFYEFEFPSCKIVKKKKKAQEGFIETVAYSNNGELVLTSSWRDKTLIAWKYKNLKKQTEFEEAEWIDNACFNKSGQIVLSGGHDNKVKLWDVSTGKMIKSFAGHDDWIYSVIFSPDEKKSIAEV